MTGGNSEPVSPRVVCTARLAQRRESAATHARTEVSISNARLATVIAFVLLLWLAMGPELLSLAWLILPTGVFMVLVVVHERVIRARRRCEKAAAFYERILARLEHRWVGQGETGERFLEEEHPYAGDLDLFGRGSIFELISAARTRAGEETLAAWLRAPSPPGEVRVRHQAVRELTDRIDLREDLFLLGADMRAGIDPELLSAWGGAPPVLPAQGGMTAIRIAAPILSLMMLTTLAAWGFAGVGPIPFMATALLAAVAVWPVRSQVDHVVGAVEGAARDLELLSSVLERIERERFTSPRLAALRATLDTEGVPPSRRIHRLRRLVELLDARRNQFFAPFGYLLLWSTQLAFAIESWRSISGHAISRWLASVGEFEALCSLAGYAWENPSDPFPELMEEGTPCFAGDGLGHPLIPPDRCVRNNIALDTGLCVLVVSGSNMSGKSTLLRTVGVNAVLAMAGAPVRAHSLRLTPLAVGASLRIHDSLQEGTSRFYAEITRLRQIMDLADGPRPALFLIDEVLHGTNSHDRSIGAEAVVRGLATRGAIGLVTTHDLALSHIVETLAPRAANVHFEDHLENGRMTFDYVMQPGVVKKSNALELMRAVGLDV